MEAVEQAQMDHQASVESEPRSVSVIGPNILVNGSIEPLGDTRNLDLQIEGSVHGDIKCSNVVLTETSKVKGNIIADRVRISGTLEGGLETTELAVEGTAKIHGDVTYEKIRVANGAVLHGKIEWRAASGDQSETSKLKLVETPPERTEPPKEVWIE